MLDGEDQILTMAGWDWRVFDLALADIAFARELLTLNGLS